MVMKVHPLLLRSHLESGSEELEVWGVVVGGVEFLQHPETGQSHLPHLVKQHPPNVLEIVVSKELDTVGGGGGGGEGEGDGSSGVDLHFKAGKWCVHPFSFPFH